MVEVELSEGARLISNIVDLGDRGLELGMLVRVVFTKVRNDLALPLFRPLSDLEEVFYSDEKFELFLGSL
jgi:hypothetical protein